jgi:hypothetical protein
MDALKQAGDIPTFQHIDMQMGLIDARIGRMMAMIRQTRTLLAAGVELQLDSRTETDRGKIRDDGDLLIAGSDTVTATNVLVHTREILERQEAAVDRMLQRRERLLALRVRMELALKEPGGGGGQGDTAAEYRSRVRQVLDNRGAREAMRDVMRKALRAKAGL